ncbi:hypothetical protein [Kistimonas asteriae]|uniref:hypothetical protein n=1 Tax=Kistimonas asteriae TaxID=517724 RepID=UPI001BA935BD|nr:hypothetical protein [Kistimonas asteriae]
MSNKNFQEIATTHYYLTDAVLGHFQQVRENATIGDWYGIGEDEFVYTLFPYSMSIEDAYNVVSPQGCPGVWHFEISNDFAAKVFIEMSVSDSDEAEWPDVEQYQRNIEKLITLWCSDGIKKEEPILPQLS